MIRTLEGVERCEQLQSLSLKIVRFEEYQGHMALPALRLLKFKRPQSLRSIDIEVVHESTDPIAKEAVAILQIVLEKGSYEPYDKEVKTGSKAKRQKL